MRTANGQTILLGEDDPEVRSYLETMLRCQGYRVELAEDGDEVLAGYPNSTFGERLYAARYGK